MLHVRLPPVVRCVCDAVRCVCDAVRCGAAAGRASVGVGSGLFRLVSRHLAAASQPNVQGKSPVGVCCATTPSRRAMRVRCGAMRVRCGAMRRGSRPGVGGRQLRTFVVSIAAVIACK